VRMCAYVCVFVCVCVQCNWANILMCEYHCTVSFPAHKNRPQVVSSVCVCVYVCVCLCVCVCVQCSRVTKNSNGNFIQLSRTLQALADPTQALTINTHKHRPWLCGATELRLRAQFVYLCATFFDALKIVNAAQAPPPPRKRF